MVDQDEGGEDDPVELVDQAEIRSSILHQAVVRVEDKENTEKDGEEHGIHVHIGRGKPSLSGGRTDEGRASSTSKKYKKKTYAFANLPG